MYKLLVFIIFFALISFSSVRGEEEQGCLLILNMKNESTLPRNFRSFMGKEEFQKKRQLFISGSGQFSEKSFKVVLENLNHPQDLYVVDLRQESHGFLDGIAVSWYGVANRANIGKTLQEIILQETNSLQKIVNQKEVVLSEVIKKDDQAQKLPSVLNHTYQISAFSTEEQMMSQYRVNYFRLPVTDAMRPTDEMVERFMTFYKSLPDNHWVHFHCSAGRGRTTSFMVMYDIVKNAKAVNFEDILQVQFVNGGKEIMDLGPTTSWKYPYFVARYQFLRDFYDYCRANADNYQTTWTQYLKGKEAAK